MSSIRSNIILNGLNTATSLLFPVITFPYAARVLLPEGIGAINFLNGIINYLILLTSLGIPMYAVKEVARCRDNYEQRKQVTLEILLLSLGLCVLGYVAVILLAQHVPEIRSQAPVFYVLSLSIVFTSIGVNWFYQAIEDFKFITIRAIIIRTLAAAALFIFVKTPADLIPYAWIVVGSTVGNNLINFIHLRSHISFTFSSIRLSRIFSHVSPALTLFAFNLITSLYINLNSVMLGFISGDEEVGYFTAGTRISHIGLTLISSIGTVLLPRCSNLLARGEMNQFATVVDKSLHLTVGMALPMTIGLMMLCRPVTLLFCGPEYGPAIPVLLLNAPVILFIGLTNLTGIQILYPKNRISIVLWSVGCGAVINLILNFLLLPSYGAVGAAVATLFAEFAVLIVQITAGRHEFPFRIRDMLSPSYIYASVVMCFVLWLTSLIPSDLMWQVIIGISAGAISYAAALYVLRDRLFIELHTLILSKLRHVRKI